MLSILLMFPHRLTDLHAFVLDKVKGLGFYSNLIIVSKAKGSECLQYFPLGTNVLHGIHQVITSLHPDLASVDIEDAYLHVPIFPVLQQYLHFAVGSQNY